MRAFYAVVGAAEKLYEFAHAQMEVIDQDAKLADRLGVSTDALVGFQHAGELAGVSNDLLTGSLEKMLKNIGAAAGGSAKAAAGFQALNLNVADLINQKPEETFAQIADAVAGIANPYDRAAAAQAIFGKSGQALLPMLMQGSAGLAAAREEADALGLSFNRIDAAKVEEANDAILKIGDVGKGVFRQLGIAIAPALTSAANLVTAWGIRVVSTVGDYLPAIVATTDEVFSRVYDTIAPVVSGIYSYVAPIVAGICNVIADNWHTIASVTSSVFSTAAGFVESHIAGIIGTLGTIGSVIFGPMVIGAITAIGGAVFSVAAAIARPVALMVGTFYAIGAVWPSIYNAVSTVATAIYQTVADNFGAIVDTSAEVFESVYGIVGIVFNAAWSIISTIGGAIASSWTATMNMLGISTSVNGNAVQGVFHTIGGAAKWLADSVSNALNIITFGLNNFGTVVDAAMVTAAYGIVRFGNEATYFFTDLIPGYLTWFGQNWSKIFTDVASFSATVFTNLASNAGAFFSALWSAIKGDGFDFKWTGLTTGFTATLDELPKIADRKIGTLEKSLGDQSDTLTAKLGTGLSDYLKDQKDQSKALADGFKGAVGDAGNELAKAFKPGQAAAPDIKPLVELPKLPTPTPTLDINTEPADAALDKTKSKAEDLKNTLVIAGSAEAMNTIAKATFESRIAKPEPLPQPRGAAGADAGDEDNEDGPVAVRQNRANLSPVSAPLSTSAVTGAGHSDRADGQVDQIIALMRDKITVILQGILDKSDPEPVTL